MHKKKKKKKAPHYPRTERTFSILDHGFSLPVPVPAISRVGGLGMGEGITIVH